MVLARLCSSSCVLVLLALAGCKTSSGEGTEGRSESSRIAFAEQWSDAIHDMGRVPIIPPTEDVYVGDVLTLSSPPSFHPGKNVAGLRTSATSRWKSLQVLPELDEEYRRRPTWEPSDPGDATTAPADSSIYRTDRVPVRHRTIGLRAMASLTVEASDLEPFLPIEIAPLIEGPATSERFAVSIQPGEAETYSLSLDTMIDQLLDPPDETAGRGYTLKPEHRGNLPLVADPITGKAYLVVVTEVLYIRSIELTVRRKLVPATGESGDAAPAPVADESEEAGPAPAAPSATEEVDHALAAILLAQSMNEALGESGRQDRTGVDTRIVMAADDAMTLRRHWAYPLAMGIRGITIEVDAQTGEVLRLGPLGVDLPDLPPKPEPQAQPDESPSGS